MEHHESGSQGRIDWLTPIIADGEAGFGGSLNVYELTKEMIEAGAAGVHYEDQLSSEKKCGHLGGKVLVPTSQFVRTMVSARLAADVMGVPTVIIARTDANGARSSSPVISIQRTKSSLPERGQRKVSFASGEDLMPQFQGE